MKETTRYGPGQKRLNAPRDVPLQQGVSSARLVYINGSKRRGPKNSVKPTIHSISVRQPSTPFPKTERMWSGTDAKPWAIILCLI